MISPWTEYNALLHTIFKNFGNVSSELFNMPATYTIRWPDHCVNVTKDKIFNTGGISMKIRLNTSNNEIIES